MEHDQRVRSSISALINPIEVCMAQTRDPQACVDLVRRILAEFLRTPNGLAPEYTVPRPESYARYLVYRHPHALFTVLSMVWLPGQGTPIHDHGGFWGAEGVYAGQMQVTPFDMTLIGHRRARAVPGQCITADRGDVGVLIPPHEHHVMANTGQETAITLHVYGGELTRCNVYRDAGDGTYYVEERVLGYTR